MLSSVKNFQQVFEIKKKSKRNILQRSSIPFFFLFFHFILLIFKLFIFSRNSHVLPMYTITETDCGPEAESNLLTLYAKKGLIDRVCKERKKE